MAPVSSQYNEIRFSILGTTPNFVINFLSQTASLVALEAAIYSASVVESAVDPCMELFQQTTPLLRVNTNPDVEFLSSGSDWKSESVYSLN